jgi:hypothetical protein
MPTRKCNWCGIGFGPTESPTEPPDNATVKYPSYYHAVCYRKARATASKFKRTILRRVNKALASLDREV